MKANFFSPRVAVLILAVAAFLLPLTALGVRYAVQSNANDVRDWLPAHYTETSQFRWFQTNFGSEEFVVVSWPGCDLEDTRLDRYAKLLREQDRIRGLRGDPARYRRVTTGRELLSQLSVNPVALTRTQFISRMKGTLVGPDGKQTCTVITLMDEARRNLHPTLGEIAALTEDAGVPPLAARLGGPPVVNAAIDRSSTQSLLRLAGLAGLIGLVVAWWCFRTVRMTVIVFCVAGYSAALSLAVVPMFGVPMNAILVTMVPLVYVAAMSGAIHLSNYYLDTLRAGRLTGAIGHALAHAALPLGLATGTTAVGLLSLLYSDLSPIRLFGVFSAIGVVIALLMQFVLLPAMLSAWPTRKLPAPDPSAAESADGTSPLPPGWLALARLVIGGHGVFATACLLLLAAGAWGLTKVETSIQIMRLFSPDTPIIAEYEWLEGKLGALVPMEIVLRFDKDNQQNMVQRLAMVERIQREIGELPPVGGSLSAATFAPNMQSSTRASLRSFMVNRRLTQSRARMVQSGYIAESENGELWRISVRVGAIDDIDYGAFQKDLRSKVDPILAATPGAQNVEAVYTGAVPIVYKARRSLLDGLILGFGTDVLLIVVAMTIAMRHWSSGLLLLLACVFPTAIVFGLMGWLGIVVDIGSVMTPCVALGVTVDDVIHFVLWFRRGIARGLNVSQSVMLAYEGCARAMVQSWGVIGLGLAAFALSSFIPTFRFGALMITLLTVGLVGNLIFLPSLLAGPLGRIIEGSMKRRQQTPRSAGKSIDADEPEVAGVPAPMARNVAKDRVS